MDSLSVVLDLAENRRIHKEDLQKPIKPLSFLPSQTIINGCNYFWNLLHETVTRTSTTQFTLDNKILLVLSCTWMGASRKKSITAKKAQWQLRKYIACYCLYKTTRQHQLHLTDRLCSIDDSWSWISKEENQTTITKLCIVIRLPLKNLLKTSNALSLFIVSFLSSSLSGFFNS